MTGEKTHNTGKIRMAEKTLMEASETYGADAVFTSSFGAEDMVITHMISSLNLDIQIATIDTGRLPQSTYELMDNSTQRYGLVLHTYFPDRVSVEDMVREKGMNLFYRSRENRKLCCGIRKVEPLGRILKDRKAWITGIRGSQSEFRQSMKRMEKDESRNVVKYNPLIDWDTEDVWNYIHDNRIEYNRLHDQGYPSIGCEPCTRAIRPGEDERAGRWWWESDVKECGLHVAENGNEDTKPEFSPGEVA